LDAIILAGGGSHDDPLMELTQGKLKSMLPIAGKPMVQWVLDALNGAPSIDTVVLIGIENVTQLTCHKKLIPLPDAGSLLENIQRGAEFLEKLHPKETHVLSLSADIPAITSEIVEALVKIYSESRYDIYYGVVDRAIMEKRYPGSKRTYIKVRDTEICGGDVNSFSKKAALAPNALWKTIITLRKNPLKQTAMIGWDTLFLLLLRRLTLDQAAERVCHKLGITGRAVQVPFAEVGMDVDKPFQFEMVQNDLMR
jgi:CTP:molybdopterin cytidylyltransferase MocA